MRPIHIVVLVLAGALGGAAIMNVVQHKTGDRRDVFHSSQPPAATPQTASAPAPPQAAPAPATTAAVPPSPAPQQQPEAIPPAAPAGHTAAAVAETHPRHHRRKSLAAAAKPARELAENRPVETAPPPVAAPPAAAPPQQPAVDPTQPRQDVTTSPVSPPARTEPEQVTPPPPAPEPPTATLNAGMLIPVRLLDGLSSDRNVPGDAFAATLDHELVAGGFVIAERGARVDGRVVAVDKGSRVRGQSVLTVELVRLHTSDGQIVPIQTDAFEKRSEPDHRQDAEKVGIGAVVGAVIGGIAGGGKGAAIGAGAGAGAGGADAVLTHKPASLPSETRISFRLRQSVTLTERINQ